MKLYYSYERDIILGDEHIFTDNPALLHDVDDNKIEQFFTEFEIDNVGDLVACIKQYATMRRYECIYVSLFGYVASYWLGKIEEGYGSIKMSNYWNAY